MNSRNVLGNSWLQCLENFLTLERGCEILEVLEAPDSGLWDVIDGWDARCLSVYTDYSTLIIVITHYPILAGADPMKGGHGDISPHPVKTSKKRWPPPRVAYISCIKILTSSQPPTSLLALRVINTITQIYDSCNRARQL